LRKIVRENPCSLNALAKAAGVSQPNLHNAANGYRPLGDKAAGKVVKTLRAWAKTFNRLADEMESAIKGETS
jgi:hypothetical protein